ncbi:chemotaxis protein CheX [Candidatus Sumerlaeota bacterium]
MEPTARQLEALRDLINAGVSKGGSVLNAMLGSSVILEVPSVTVVSVGEFAQEMRALGSDSLATVCLGFSGDFSGTARMIFPTAAASKLVTTLTGDEPGLEDLDSIRAGTLCEIGNIVLNGVVGTISNVFRFQLEYNVPYYQEKTAAGLLASANRDPETRILVARTRFEMAELEIDGDIVMFFEVKKLDAVIRLIDAYAAEPESS